MQLPIEQWASEVSLPGEAIDALREAGIAYRAGAYRAGLLFTYVSWGLVLRRRILASRCPPNVTQRRWGDLQSHMQNEDRWDAAVFDATQAKDAAAIFNVRDDLRTQVKYWKDRRNDCAHSKNNAITAAHVEALWEFMRWNLDKFVPGGSVEDLVERIREHFDPNLTRPGTGCDPLAQVIESAVPPDELERFFQTVLDMFASDFGGHLFIRDECIAFFEAAMRVGPPHVTTPLGLFLLSRADLFASVVRAHPHLVLLAHADARAVRQLWRTNLGKADPATVRVYATMLRNGLIPAAEVAEANRHVLSLRPTPPSEEDAAVLQRYGFFEAFQQAAFEQRLVNSFSWGNPNAQLLAWCVYTFPLDERAARAVGSLLRAAVPQLRTGRAEGGA